MVKFEVVRGKKGPEDRLVLVYAYGEPLSFSDLLFILDSYFKSEDSYYPLAEGYQGKCMLMKAILEVYSGIPLERILKNYKLERKGNRTVIIEKIEKEPNSVVLTKKIERLEDIL